MARKIRVTLDLTPPLYVRLGRLAESIGGTKTQALRNAMALYECALEDGTKILVQREGETRELLVLR